MDSKEKIIKSNNQNKSNRTAGKTEILTNYKKFSPEIRTLNPKTRNKVRAIISENGKHSLRLLNKIRERSQSSEVIMIERVLRLQVIGGKNLIPELFPREPQTAENCIRLTALPIEKYLTMFATLISSNHKTCTQLVLLIRDLDNKVIKLDMLGCDQKLKEIYEKCGYSHLLLRKAALIKSLNAGNKALPFVEEMFNQAGLGKNNIIASSILQSFQEEQDFLTMKRSIMGLRDKGNLNKFTRDIIRLAFHPHAKDTIDLCEMIQSNTQSSLIDAIILLKINRRFFKVEEHPALEKLFFDIDTASASINSIVRLYEHHGGEASFHKHSSAWLENGEVIKYRTLLDFFSDDPDAPYTLIDDSITDIIENWTSNLHLNEIASSRKLTKHQHDHLAELEYNGLTTRSAVYNYLVHKSEGNIFIEEDKLIEIMEKTHDLNKTINVEYHRNLAANSGTILSRVIIYLLIAKKSSNEVDNYSLRRNLQELIKNQHNDDILSFIKSLQTKSETIAIYAYEIFTEDFISKLSHLIHTSYDITVNRAKLHAWMYDVTKEQIYLDRFRSMHIDHQINKIRNEIDDNRIYVDISRFLEWVDDEVVRDLDTALASQAHNKLERPDDPQLLLVIETCYNTFCKNNIFGIASYLGRRIRHGTFKGHLYSSVISIEKKYPELAKDPTFAEKWTRWKANYQKCVDQLIRDYLHVQSSDKPRGLIKSNIDVNKYDTVIACSSFIIRDFHENNSSLNSPQILAEYCWRLVEHDLNNIRTFLKGKKAELLQHDLLMDLRLTNDQGLNDKATEFSREIHQRANEKLSAMLGWFKRPASISPQASINLLYRAVVAEVLETHPELKADTAFNDEDDFMLAGLSYHVIYDALYVIVFNAAKHGKIGADVNRHICLRPAQANRKRRITVSITSSIEDHEDEDVINNRLKVAPEENFHDANLTEGRSGIRKLYLLQQNDSHFSIEDISCQNRLVNITFSYGLEY